MQALAIITLPSYLVSVSLPQKTVPNCFLWLDYHSVHQHNRTLQALAIITLPFYCLVCLLLGMRWFDFFSSQFVLLSQFAHECIPIVGRQLGYRCGAVHALAGGLILTSQSW